MGASHFTPRKKKKKNKRWTHLKILQDCSVLDLRSSQSGSFRELVSELNRNIRFLSVVRNHIGPVQREKLFRFSVTTG